MLLASLREHGTVLLFSTAIQGSHGSQADVEICAVAAPRGKDASFGFSIRRRLVAAVRGAEARAGIAAFGEADDRVAWGGCRSRTWCGDD